MKPKSVYTSSKFKMSFEYWEHTSFWVFKLFIKSDRKIYANSF